MKNQITSDQNSVINLTKEKKSRRETYGKKNSRYKRNGFEIFLNGRFNLHSPPYGFNYVLGYCQDTVSQDNTVI